MSTETVLPLRPHDHCFGLAGNCTKVPEYVWTGPHGGEYDLCAECCAEWRLQTHETPIGPSRIRSLQSHLWPCGCLINDAGAHRVGCPDHPEGVRG